MINHINFSKSQGGIIQPNKNPGPGHYNLHSTEMSSKGSYFVSKFKDSMCRSFGNSLRKSISSGNLSKMNKMIGFYE